MINQFIDYINKENLFKSSDKILLAISGGPDSMLMLKLFKFCGFNFSIAHCNFKLRDRDSDEDENFVRHAAEESEVRFYSNQFDTIKYASDNKISIEMAARKLRYDWFAELLNNKGFDYIATAHHLDDSIETFFINLLRGTGISGLHGILPKQNKIIRPLLFTTKSEILNYLNDNGLSYRLDKSNDVPDILRNKLRHYVVPVLKKINPEFEKTFLKTIENIKETEMIYKYFINKKSQKLFIKKDDSILISINKLIKLKPLRTYTYELLSQFNFNISQVDDIISVLNESSSKQFVSSSHRLLKDRNYLIVSSISNVVPEIIDLIIEEHTNIIYQPVRLEFNKVIVDQKFSVSKDSTIANLDFNKLSFPLILRKWKFGDYFYPLGMTKKKKLSRFFIDIKLSLVEKQNIFVLCSGEKLVWIVGLRVDDRFKITNNTKNALIIKMKNEK